MSLDSEYGVKQEERRRCVASRKRCRASDQNSSEWHNFETDSRQGRQIDVRSCSQRLTRTSVGRFVAAMLGMIFGVRSDGTRVSVERPGADMAHHDHDCDSNQKD